MMSKRDIAKIAKRVLKRQRGVRDHQIIHPKREWLIGLLGGLFLIVLGASWSFVTFREVQERGIENTDATEVQQISYREDMIKTALEKTHERQENYQNLLDEWKSYQPPVEEVEEEELEVEPEPEDEGATEVQPIEESITTEPEDTPVQEEINL